MSKSIKIQHGLYVVQETIVDENGNSAIKTISTHKTHPEARKAAGLEKVVVGDNRDPEEAAGLDRNNQNLNANRGTGEDAPVNRDPVNVNPEPLKETTQNAENENAPQTASTEEGQGGESNENDLKVE